MSKGKRLTKLEILNETISFYSEDISRRAVSQSDGCVYNTEDGRHCAVGRCFTKKIKAEGFIFELNIDNDVQSLEEKIGLNYLLKKKYLGHKVDFWVQLQQLHDMRVHWGENGLTKFGLNKVKLIKEKFGITE